MQPFILYGWKLSYYTAKISCYLTYKRIPHVFKPMNAFDLFYTAPKKTGASVMPIIRTPEKEWLQDTRGMIEYFEKRYPNPSVFPRSRELRFLANLLEAWEDEFWVPFAMHYRWRYPKNVEFFRNEASNNFLPSLAPQFLKDPIVDRTMSVLTNFLPSVGDRPEQFQMIEEWTHDILSKLNSHFAVSPYLLGHTATIGDFGLAGPLVAHLCRDPYSAEELMKPFEHVMKWSDRISLISHSEESFQESQTIPPTLIPILRSIFEEFIPLIIATVQSLHAFERSPKFSAGKKFPRRFGEVEIPLLEKKYSFRKRGLPFNLWKFQKVMEVYLESSESQVQIDKFLHLHSLPFEVLHQVEIPPLERSALKVYRV